MRFNPKLVFVVVVLVASGALATTAFLSRPRETWVEGAVIVAAPAVEEQSPIAGVTVAFAGAGRSAPVTKTDGSGFFRLALPEGTRRGQRLTLAFRHPDYHPLNVAASAGGDLVVTRMAPVASRPAPAPKTTVANIRMRYSLATANLVNVGSGVRMFQAVNNGNVPCNGREPCSPDGRWKAGIGAATLDAGPDNEFRNARLSCIAGPCAFTRIDADRFSRGGRVIEATVRAWSDTATFVLEAEVMRRQISDVVRETYPVILGRTMNFTLPAAAEGPSIEAEIDGVPIVFPLGPKLLLSWADCEARAATNQSKIYRCDLKPAYGFQ